MRKFIALAVIAGIIGLGSSVAFACNSKAECMKAGKEAYAAKHYKEAKDYFKKAIQFDPKCEKAWSWYDKVYKMMIIKELNEEEGC